LARRGGSTITLRVLAALALMSVTGLGGSLYAVAQLRATDQVYADLINNEARAMRRVSRAAILALDDSRLLLRLLVETEPSYRERLLGERDRNQRYLYDVLDEAAALMPRLQAPIASFSEQFTVLVLQSHEIEDLAMAGKLPAALEAVHRRRDPMFVELRRQMRDLVQQLEDEMQAASARAIQASQITGSRTLGVVGLGVLISLLLMAQILQRSVTRPLLEIEGRMRALQAGDVASPVPGRKRRDEIGRMSAALESFRLDAIERRRLDQAVSTDPLTGLLNRRGVASEVQCFFQKDPLMVAIAIDLDHFKETNDLFGHAAGDALLVAVARRIRTAVRPGDLVGRLGGDEFLVVLSAPVSPEVAEEVAERIQLVLHRPVVHQSRILRLGATLGVAVRGAEHDSAEAVLRQADEILVRTKKQQRGSIGRLSA
jgi:diguanylate cyclase (GGDEF)-like protein